MNNQYLYDDNSAHELKIWLTSSHIRENIPNQIVIPNGIILPRIENDENHYSWGKGGVIDNEGQFVMESSERGFGGIYTFQEEITEYDFDVIYLGYLIQHWGVFLVDFFRRLYNKLTININTKIAFCGIDFRPKTFGSISEQCWKLLELLGINKNDIIDIRKPSRFKNVIIPDPGYEYKEYIYKEFLIPYNKISQEVVRLTNKQNSSDRIYLSRRKFLPRKEAGEKIIERFFRINGFEIVYPEQLSLIEQVNSFVNARIIASIEGTIAHNILFCSNNTRQIIIRKQKELNYRQLLFNEIKETNIQYIDCYYQPISRYPLDHDRGPFLLLWNKNLKNFAIDKSYKMPRFCHLNNLYAVFEFALIVSRRELGLIKRAIKKLFSSLCGKNTPENYIDKRTF